MEINSVEDGLRLTDKNMKKIFISLGVTGAIFVVILTVRILSGSEDTWICTGDGWQKHGNPDASMPETVCGDQKLIQKEEANANNLLGGDRDENDCIGSAGYSWCPSTQKCQRMWEEYCEEYKDQFRGSEKADNNQVDKSDLIQLDFPVSGATITSPLTVTGQARGSWFFEGSFPVLLVDWDGKIIAQTQAKAQKEWTTDEFVPFSAELQFEKPNLYDRGNLILKKDNPSGLSKNDDALEIPVSF